MNDVCVGLSFAAGEAGSAAVARALGAPGAEGRRRPRSAGEVLQARRRGGQAVAEARPDARLQAGDQRGRDGRDHDGRLRPDAGHRDTTEAATTSAAGSRQIDRIDDRSTMVVRAWPVEPPSDQMVT